MQCLLRSPRQPWEFAKQFHWGYHTGDLNSQTSFPCGPHASQACHFTVLQTQHGFTLAWFCTCNSLCQESSPSLPCTTKECPLHSGKPWVGRERPFSLGHSGVRSTQGWGPCQRQTSRPMSTGPVLQLIWVSLEAMVPRPSDFLKRVAVNNLQLDRREFKSWLCDLLAV